MKYLIRQDILDKAPEIEITAEKYAELGKAHNILTNALAIEEKYEILIANYLDFEKQILDTAIECMVRENYNLQNFFEFRLKLNTRIVNLLTAVRLYQDQAKQNVPKCVPNNIDAQTIVKKFFSKEFDENVDYQFMEGLRNYVQHKGLPVHWTQLDRKRISVENDFSLEYSIELGSRRSYLEEDRSATYKYKSSVLTKYDNKIDLKAATRNYVESIGNVHESIRSLTTQSVSLAREIIEETHRKYLAVYNGHLVALSASEWSDKEQISSIPLLLDWDDIRVKLQERNKKTINLKKRYITSIIKNFDA